MKRILSIVLAISLAAAVFTVFTLKPVAALNAAFSGKLWFVAGTLLLLAVLAVSDWRISAVHSDTVRRRKNPRWSADPADLRRTGPAFGTVATAPTATLHALPGRRRSARVSSAKNHPAVISR